LIFRKLKDFCLTLKEKKSFQYFVIIVILIASSSIGAKTYNLNQTFINFLLFFDGVITLIFLTEIIIRFLGEKTTKDFFSNGWNIFDLVVVLASLIPASLAESVLILRLLRLFRLLRIISFVPELQQVVENLFNSLKKSTYIILLLFIITYIYAVIGTIYFSEIPGNQFNTLGESMITLAQVGTMSSWEQVLAPISKSFPFGWIYFVSYIFMCGIVVLNLLIGMIVELVVNQRKDIETE
jgi:voltage-gated sodium channel|tara:strand:- start:3391 stop:4107 length:717 start_codon:yes stop_codon:yes gene_type:complete